MCLAPVLANAAATINQMAPGRVELGIGTGFNAVALMGQKKPAKQAELREYVRVVRALLDGEEVDHTFKGITAPIRFQIPDGGFINLKDRIPIHIPAMGPKGQELAGELADGVYSSWGPVEAIPALQANLEAGAARSGRSLDGFRIFAPAAVIALEAGEEITSDRVMELGGLTVILVLHNMYEKFGRCPADRLPPFIAPFWDAYCDSMEAEPEGTRHYRRHAGHGTYIDPRDKPFVTPELIKIFCNVGRPEEIVELMRSWDAAGITDTVIYFGWKDFARNVQSFSTHVLKKL
jgi:5,10-methylenetetrahydromethanopterin reductase